MPSCKRGEWWVGDGEEMCSTWPGLWHERLDARGTCKGACLGPPWARCDVVRHRIIGTRKARFPLPQKTHLHHLPQRAHGAQLLHVRHGELHGAVHLLVRGEAAQAVAYGRVRHVLLHAQGPQHIAGLQRGARAGAAAGHGDVLGGMGRAQTRGDTWACWRECCGFVTQPQDRPYCPMALSQGCRRARMDAAGCINDRMHCHAACPPPAPQWLPTSQRAPDVP